jgi:hypothetical protein
MQTFSAFKRIKNYLCCTEGQKGLSHLCYQQESLYADLKHQPNFYDQVTEKTVEVDTTEQLHFK